MFVAGRGLVRSHTVTPAATHVTARHVHMALQHTHTHGHSSAHMLTLPERCDVCVSLLCLERSQSPSAWR